MWTVEIGAYSLKENEVGKTLPVPDVSRQHADPVDALLDLESAIETCEGHEPGLVMGCTYAIVAPDGRHLALNVVYREVFGHDHISVDGQEDRYPELRKAERKKETT